MAEEWSVELVSRLSSFHSPPQSLLFIVCNDNPRYDQMMAKELKRVRRTGSCEEELSAPLPVLKHLMWVHQKLPEMLQVTSKLRLPRERMKILYTDHDRLPRVSIFFSCSRVAQHHSPLVPLTESRVSIIRESRLLNHTEASRDAHPEGAGPGTPQPQTRISSSCLRPLEESGSSSSPVGREE
jgi:hypothetical protein